MADDTIDDGGLAFPAKRYQAVDMFIDADGATRPTFADVDHPGMTLRDWFAGHALIGLIPAYQAAYGSPTAECVEIVREAYGYADIMIAARKAGA
ncbi:hypothetical protein [Rhizobium lusitanum]|uniref:Uncharacterized protein n=1 Tax=Rhizobium lusitanum TaxID=293958 RepID=A0A1C3VS13_9HYPH|nr:hypothetical protein [Rhizobium lusitanum]SCB30576.1 hypothetical protein GA0061101_106127 [Rhizobium lusitanum]